MRGVAPACLLPLLLNHEDGFNFFVEVFLLGGIALYVAIVRALRPYMNEIILLERNPLRARSRAAYVLSTSAATDLANPRS